MQDAKDATPEAASASASRCRFASCVARMYLGGGAGIDILTETPGHIYARIGGARVSVVHVYHTQLATVLITLTLT